MNKVNKMNKMQNRNNLNQHPDDAFQGVVVPRHRALGSLLALALLAATLPAAADHHRESHQLPAAAGAQDAVSEFVNAEVRKIDPENGKLTLKHEAIRKFDMAGMTMAFRVAEPAMLDGLTVGDRVRFIPDKRNGQFVITQIEKLD